MKHFIAVLACAFLATALAAPSVDENKAKESLKKVKAAHDACNADPATQIDLEAAKKAHKAGEHWEDPNISAHTLCVSKKLGWQNEDGSVNVELIRSRASSIFGDNTKIEETITECTQSQDTPEATAKHLFECYRKNAPRPEGHHPDHH